MDLVRWQLVELHNGGGEAFERPEDPPDHVRGDDILHAVEDRLLIDLGLFKDMPDIDNLHVPEIDLEDGKARGDLPGDAPRDPERLFRPYDRDDDVGGFRTGMIIGDTIKLIVNEKDLKKAKEAIKILGESPSVKNSTPSTR